MKKYLLIIVSILWSTITFSQANVTVGPYLQSPTPTSIKIKWRSDVAASSKVLFGLDPSNLNQTVIDTAVTTWHTVLLSGLNPYTQYFYSIYNNNVFGEGGDSSYRFRTFPVSTDPGHVRVWAIGDFGKGNSKQQKVRDSYPLDLVETNLWLWLGDNVYENGTEQEYLDKVFDSVWGYRKIMKHLPFEPAPGNHDYGVISPPQSTKPPLQHAGPYFDFVDVYTNAEAGGVPTGHELFYSFDYRNVHFISLNSELGSPTTPAHNWTGVSFSGNTFTSSPMSDWLVQDLSTNTKPWVIAYWHQPPYADGSHRSAEFYEVYMKAMRENYCKILEQYGVDLVICGHDHTYERSYLVHGCYGDESNIGPANYVQTTSGKDSLGEAYIKYATGANPNLGTVYVNNGNSGSDYGSADFLHPYMYAEYGCDGCLGSFVIDVDSNRLVGRHIDGNRITRDEFTIYKMGISTGIEKVTELETISKILIAPNPFHNSTIVSFELLQNEYVSIRLMDVTGKLTTVLQSNLNKGNQQVEINAQQLKLAKGIYTLQLSTGKQSISRSLVVQ